jgi:hypothetical protein
MLSRRDFIEAAVVTLPIVGSSACAKGVGRKEPAIGDLSPKQMEAVRTDAAQFENALNAVRKADVPYSVAPRFYPPAV